MVTYQKTYNLNDININNYKNITDFSDFSNNNVKIIAKKYTYCDNTYTIVKYNKSLLDKEDYSTLGVARSIIINNGKIICFSPPKSLEYNTFKESNSSDECFAEDFIDGTMINLFFDDSKNEWEVATRSTVGANTQFFVNSEDDKRSFRDMFFEACQLSKIDFNLLDNNFCYSFVLQHPNNRIVTPIDFPKVYLIRAYNINNETNLVTEVANEVLLNNSGGFWNTDVLYPQRYAIDNYENLENYYNNSNTPFYCVGIVVNSKSGRTKVRNQNYENIRELRGNQSRLKYHYLTLRKNGRVKDFLTFYGEFAPYFSEYRKTIHLYTNNLYSNYIKCYIRKQQELKLFPYEFKVHMFNLHQKYLSDIKPNGGYIDKNYVIEYFNGLHPSQQMHILNCRKKYNLKEINIEIK
mgnify:CR=1 FL=1|tara:strand:- start:1377 stop:2600 length:1224 start_codon:yes stop_codon:yes gene_type:complete